MQNTPIGGLVLVEITPPTLPGQARPLSYFPVLRDVYPAPNYIN